MILYQILLLLLPITGLAKQNYNTLESIRNLIDVVPYTPSQRIQVAKSVKNMFSVIAFNQIYVNRQSKIDNYQNDYDLVSQLQSIVEKSAAMTDIDFHYQMVDLFMSLRDIHTQYQIPGSHACLAVLKMISFAAVELKDQQAIVVSRISSNADILRLSQPAAQINIGDQLISIDGVAIKKYLKNLAFTTGGANESGSRRAALSALSVVNGKLNKMPDVSKNSYRLKSINGTVYTVTLPWIAVYNSECWDQAKEMSASIASGNPNKTFRLPLKPKASKNDRETMDNASGRFFDNKFGKKEGPAFRIHPTDSSIIQWAIYKPESKNLGIIFLESFEFSRNPVEIIQRLLKNELKDTNALIFDVRWNGGGSIEMADKIPQLFSSAPIRTASARLLANDINRDILLKSQYGQIDRWGQSLQMTKKGDTFTPLLHYTEEEDANRLGQAYVRPVGVFVNGACYSACELFAANMKDNKVATIFGEDAFTGGGGSNPVDYNSFLNGHRPDYFPSLPWPSLQNFKVSWKQTVRIDGTLLEDLGVASDHIIRPTIADLQQGSESFTQYDRIANTLIREGIADGKNRLYFQIQELPSDEIAIGDPLILTFETEGYGTIGLFDESGNEIGRISVRNSAGRTKQSVPYVRPNAACGTVRFNIRAWDFAGNFRFSTWRKIRYNPRKTDYFVVSKKTNIDLKEENKFMGIYEDGSKRGLGWTKGGVWLFSNTLRIFDGNSYGNNLDSWAQFFFSSTNGFKLTIRASYNTEQGYDYLHIGYKQDQDRFPLLYTESYGVVQRELGVSGKGVLETTYELPAGELMFYVQFTSDSSITGVGATIHSIIVE